MQDSRFPDSQVGGGLIFGGWVGVRGLGRAVLPPRGLYSLSGVLGSVIQGICGI